MFVRIGPERKTISLAAAVLLTPARIDDVLREQWFRGLNVTWRLK